MDKHIGGVFYLDGRCRVIPWSSIYLMNKGFSLNEAEAYLQELKKTSVFSKVKAKIEQGSRSVLEAIGAVCENSQESSHMRGVIEASIGIDSSSSFFEDTHKSEEILTLLDNVIKHETKPLYNCAACGELTDRTAKVRPMPNEGPQNTTVASCENHAYSFCITKEEVIQPMRPVKNNYIISYSRKANE